MDQQEEHSRDGSAGSGVARAYDKVRKELLSEFGADFYRSYIDPLRLVAEWNGSLLFRAGSQVARERLRQQVQHRLEARLRVYEPKVGPIEILLEHEIPEDVRALADARLEQARAKPAVVQGQSSLFESFCSAPSNERALAVARMIADGTATFPVWLVHSPPGCGKSHLLNAIASDRKLRMPECRVLLLTGQDYLEGFQSALQKRDATGFKEYVRAPELLLIDDFHRICGKRMTEVEAFDTIHEVTRRGGQVVLAANHGAEGLEGLDETLRSKLKGAASCEIHEPDAELRRRILDVRVRYHALSSPGFSVAADALDFIAERMHVTGRELDGAICQLLIEWKISGGKEVTLEAATNALQNKLSDAAEKRITVQLVQKVVARHYAMSTQQLLERTRRHTIARPRQVAMFLACKMTHASLPDIGQRFGGFDHTTIMYARDRIAEMMEKDPAYKAEIEAIARAVRREP